MSEKKSCLKCGGKLDCMGIFTMNYPEEDMIEPDFCSKCAFSRTEEEEKELQEWLKLMRSRGVKFPGDK